MREEVSKLDKQASSPGVVLFPGMSGAILEVMANKFHALILIGNALGGIASDLLPYVKKITEQGVAIFVLTDNAGAGHGVLRIVDQPQVDALKNGVTYFEKANILTEQGLRDAIDRAVAEGLRGSELANHVKAQFTYNEGEEIPVTDLGKPEGLASFKERVEREMGSL